MQTSLAYLYSNASGNRFWYDTRPTLRKTVEDRAIQFNSSDVDYEIERRLKKLRKEAPFAGVHICPASSLDIPDEQAVRWVILRPSDEYRTAQPDDNHAMQVIKDFLDNRGTSPRIYRNMLAFIAPDQELMSSLKQEVRRFLAWQSIQDDSEDLNLDVTQNRKTENNLHRSNDTVELRIKEVYCWLLTPYVDRSIDMKTITWDTIQISGGNDSLVTKAAKKMQQNEALITKWAPALLLMELDGILWKDSDSIALKKLWDYLCTYCYLPGLARYDVLEDTIRTGVNAHEYFALAAGIGEKRYIDLKLGQFVGNVDRSAYLVKVAATNQQIEGDRAAAEEKQHKDTSGGTSITPGGGGITITLPEGGNPPVVHIPTPEPPKNKHFFMSAKLDNTRLNRDVQRLVEEVISHLSSLDDTRVGVSLEVTATAKDGVPLPIVRTVSENCRTLKVQDFGFDD